ncbi:alpha-(1,6)-fucosyltransferase-like, partial [Hoplias malabaricus]|uniref:alpha-(1,6)-fucosyltransferase-like n=1 Tax=Hoplias malabaricus TaxID=27720 RepID=UPI003461DCD3
MRPWTGSWRWITLVLLAWGTLLFYIGGHLVRDSEHPERSSRELSKILAKLERLKQQNEDLRRMAETLRCCFSESVFSSVALNLLRLNKLPSELHRRDIPCGPFLTSKADHSSEAGKLDECNATNLLDTA